MADALDDLMDAHIGSNVPAAPVDPIDEAMDYYASRKRERLQGSLATSVTTNPDTYANQKRMAAAVGVPPIVAQTIPDEIKRRADVQRVKDDTAEAPILAGKYGDRDFAQLAHDDSGPLSAIESAIRYLVGAPGAPRGGFMSDLGRVGKSVTSAVPAAGGSLYGAAASVAGVADQYLQTLDDLAAVLTGTEKRQIVGTPGPESWLLGQQKGAEGVAKGMMPDLANAGPEERGFWSGLQSGGQNLLTLPLGILGGEAMMLGTMGAFTYGQSYGKGRETLSPLQSLAFASEDAVAEVVTEKLWGAGGLLKNIKAGASTAKLFMYEIGKEVPGEIGATLWQNFNEWTNVNPDKSVGDFINEQPDAIRETIIATLVGGSVQIGAVKGAEKVMGKFSDGSNQAAQAQMAGQQLDTIAALAQASKLKERSPETFQQFARELADAHTPAIFVDAQALMQSGVNIQEVAQAMPSVAAQLQQAVATGGDIEIPTAEFVRAVPGSTFQQQLIDHARTGADAMSRAEADVFMKDKGDAIKAEIEAEAAKHEQDADWQMRRNEVRAGFEQQLNAAGRFQPAVNKQYAAVLGDFYAVTASRAGMTPQELVQRYPLRIQATAPGGAANSMEQGTPLPKVSLATLPRDMREQLFNEHAMNMNPDATERGFYAKRVPSGTIALAGLKVDEIPATQLERYKDAGKLPPIVIADGRLIDGQHRIAAARAQGLTHLQYIDMSGLIDTNAGGFISELPQSSALSQSAPLPATIDIDGQQRPTTNSKGQQIAATEEGVRNFWKWFGDSKVVDADGKPLVVYHGTDKKFSKINLKKGAQGLFWFTSDRAAIEAGDVGASGSGVIMEMYAKLESPANWQQYDQLMLDEFKSRGLDGAILPEGDGSFVGFVMRKDENQIKAVNNTGTFDPGNPSILNQSAAPAAPTREEIDLRKRHKVLESLLECLG